MASVPPGRAGRLWLIRRLHTSRLAADLLDRKLRILHAEQQRLQSRAEQTRQRWQDSWWQADRWSLRGAMTGGQRELRLAESAHPVQLTIEWSSVMGVRYPAGAACVFPQPAVGERSPGSAALVEAANAYRTAIQAAAAHAAADAACRAVAAEITTTRRRRRALTNRWIPRLEAALRNRTRQLDEDELAENVRLRWAAGRR